MSEFPKVHRYAARFMMLPRDHVNAYVVELDNAVVVIDGGLALDSATELRALAESFGKPLKALLMTHGHPDHYVGLVKFTDLPRYASQGALDFAHREDIAKASTAKGYLGDAFPSERVFPDQVISDGAVVTVDGVDFTFTDLGPGESDSDGMWTFSSQGVLHAFPGDVVANRCHCFFRDGHAEEWLANLDRLEALFRGKTVKLYQGHGEAPSEPADVVAWQRGYIETFLATVDAITERSEPVSREIQEKVIAAMQAYLPGETTLFLLDYEMDVFLPMYWKKRGLENAAA